jgi:putative ABC transport system permease protein
MRRLAFRNLVQNIPRLLISVAGVGLALLLILALDAIFAGVETQITSYIENSGADVWVSQEDVLNMHMAYSSLPDSVARRVERIPGVESVSPILYVTTNIITGDERNLAYIIGLPAGARLGIPWQISAGRGLPLKGEAVIDRSIAEKSGISLGDQVEILGEDFQVTGLSSGTASLVSSIAFISEKDFEDLRGSNGTFSFLLVKVMQDASSQAVAAQIQQRVRNVTAQSTQDFAGQERRVVKDMSIDVITIMNLIGFLIGLAVLSLTVYTSTLSRRQEYGMLKALGARNSDLYRTVLAQALYSVTLGLVFGLGVTILLALVLRSFGSNLVFEIRLISLIKVAGVSLLTAGVAAMIPIRQIARLDPARVYRGR